MSCQAHHKHIKRGTKVLRCGRRRQVSTFVDEEQITVKDVPILLFVREGGQSASAPHNVGIHSHAFTLTQSISVSGNNTTAYMRGKYYLWTDGSGLHLWAYDGYDGWDQTGWHEADFDDENENAASGVSIHQEIMGEYVMMRVAEMISEGKIETAIDRIVDLDGRGGNFGSRLLRANAGVIKQALKGLQKRPPPPWEWEQRLND